VLIDANGSGTNKALRLKTGELGSPGSGSITSEWMLSSDMNLAVRLWSNRWALVTRDLKLREMGWRRFENASGEDVRGALSSFFRDPGELETVDQAFLIPEPDQLPWTLAFKTRSDQGLLQILGFTEQPPGVRIRYKLVHRPVN